MIGKITDEIINALIMEFRKEENQEKIKGQVIDPMVCYILDKCYPYLIISSIIFILTFLLAVMILVMILYKNKIV